MTNIYLVSDIFGLTPALLTLKNELTDFLAQSTMSVTNRVQTTTPISIVIVDPYQGQHMEFSDEASAYAYFIENVGVDKYAEHLYSVLANFQNNATNQPQPPTIVIGFSVGASAMWSISDKSNLNVDQAIYFYGSQIRHLLNIQPLIKSTMILPHSEVHFDINVLHEKLKSIANVSIKLSNFYHGFMNQNSVNFNKQAYTIYSDWLCGELI